jgi:hypothetical protein
VTLRGLFKHSPPLPPPPPPPPPPLFGQLRKATRERLLGALLFSPTYLGVYITKSQARALQKHGALLPKYGSLEISTPIIAPFMPLRLFARRSRVFSHFKFDNSINARGIANCTFQDSCTALPALYNLRHVGSRELLRESLSSRPTRPMSTTGGFRVLRPHNDFGLIGGRSWIDGSPEERGRETRNSQCLGML